MQALLRIVASCTLALGACDRAGPPRPPVGEPMEPAATAPSPKPSPTATAPAADGLTGEVAETMDSGGYTYVRIGDVWAAVPQAKIAVGQTATITNTSEMTNFESKTLGRTFPSILFGTLGGGAAAANPHGGTKSGPGPAALDAPIARADGATGRTVAEVFAQKAKLADQQVAVRGKVTKFNANILGKNWLHLQDGSGSADTGDFDLIVTSADTAAVGDVVVVNGVVHLDRDFGAGYAYAVIVEDATVTR